MKEADLQMYQERLRALRSRVRGDVLSMSDAALNQTGSDASGELSRAPTHPADVGSDAYEQEFTLSLVEHDEDTLKSIEVALERIRTGDYGSCVECNARIPKARLNAIPFTPHCVKCAGKLE
ncbi:TraR/DksA family transcriptional regulator [Lignipirellula cremea]|uniref:RNA polymerase-binding transcription factor DksA n=1 Tax=Lignipirellula cremea TaxID=2528010 RepID=A0A518E3G0_9BACT|nr:TraR/DksA C4-type zinc finger protein [Lignipirellula cremea]QDU98636.1 RNA polymerase-binding transcription factor DksA [Lignipirellula cremea]